MSNQSADFYERILDMARNPADHVLDYQAMGRTKKPRCLHRPDCTHPSATAKWRPATPQELKELRVCRDCAGA